MGLSKQTGFKLINGRHNHERRRYVIQRSDAVQHVQFLECILMATRDRQHAQHAGLHPG